MAKIHFRPYTPNQTILFPQRIDEDIAGSTFPLSRGTADRQPEKRFPSCPKAKNKAEKTWLTRNHIRKMCIFAQIILEKCDKRTKIRM